MKANLLLSSLSTIAVMIATPYLASAQETIGGGHGYERIDPIPWYQSGPLRNNRTDYPKLVAFGRCVVNADYPNSNALLTAYKEGFGLRTPFARLTPVISKCRKRSVAGSRVEQPRIAAAYILGAAVERFR